MNKTENVKTVKTETEELLNKMGFAVEYIDSGFTVENIKGVEDIKGNVITATCIDWIRNQEQVRFVSVSMWQDNKVKALFFWK